MAIKLIPYWYDRSQVRFIEQIIRAFSGLQYMTGPRNGQPGSLVIVPVKHAAHDKMVAQIIQNGSDNVALTVPAIAVYQTGMRFRRSDLQNPLHTETHNFTEREKVNGQYTGNPGRRISVERIMPMPWEMDVKVDIWTSNLDQKYQIMEQIATLFYPDVHIQNSENVVDWGAITLMKADDEINWTTRSIPIGTANDIDVTSITLKVPIWISPPAKMTQTQRIEQIVANVLDAGSEEDAPTPISQTIITPGNHAIRVEGNKLILLGQNGGPVDGVSWKSLINQYGTLRPGETKIRVKTNPDIESDEGEIIGTIQFDSNLEDEVFWQVDPDTLPSNTYTPIRGIIDPRVAWPGNKAPVAAEGHRYLLLNDLVSSPNWGGLTARTNQIVQYVGGNWVVQDDPTTSNVSQFVINSARGQQLRWNGTEWVLAVEGTVYPAGMWRLTI